MLRAPDLRLRQLALVLGLLLATAPVYGQSSPPFAAASIDFDAILAQEGYLRPPEIIERAVLAARNQQVSLTNVSPDGERFVYARTEVMPTLSDFAKLHYNLAGWFIDPVANRARSLTTRTDVGLDLITSRDGRTLNIQAPRGARITNPRWSPDGREVAFFANTDTETHIYIADAATGRSRQLTRSPVLATHVTNFDWTADGQHIITVLIPANRGPEPTNGPATTPKVRVAQDAENRLRTYNSLLETPRDMALVRYYSTGQLAKINVRTRAVQNIGQPAMLQSVSASPDGRYFRVRLLREPFSYLVPLSNFATAEEVWDERGTTLVNVATQPLREGVSQAPAGGAGGGGGGAGQGQDTGRRSLSWRPDGPGMYYLQRAPAGPRGQAQDQGQAAAPGAPQAPGAAAAAPSGGAQQAASTRPDRLIQWLPPFTDQTTEVVYETSGTINTVRYSDDGRLLVLTETEGGWQHTFAMDLADPSTKHTITRVRTGGNQGGGAANQAQANATTQDDAAASGTVLMMRGASGLQVVRLSSDRQHVFLSGTTRSNTTESDDPDNAEPDAEASRPFIDRLNFRTGELTRIFEGDPSYTESVAAVLDNDVTAIVLSRQTATMVPQSIRRNLVTGEERQLTQNQDFTLDELKNMQRMTFEARRADGLMVRVRVALPPDFQPGDRLPAIFWFYPREYTSFDAYYRTSRVASAADGAGPGRYPTFGPASVQFFTLLGYAVVEPDSPIIGPDGRANDNYVHDLRNNLTAIIDELDRRGIADRERLAIGGHSYGGFSTANAMVHTPYFKAGISGAGNFNRLLTPLGFQNERRDLWTARETYLSMSALLHANQLTGALLLYHGMEDQNVGTNPINSERLFHALNGLGKTTALYMYPYEDHGQVTQESRLDMWARWTAWLDKYVKNSGQPTPSPVLAAEENGDQP